MSEATLWQRLLPLALGAGVSPLLLLGQLAQLIGPEASRVQLRRSGAYLLGTTLVVLIWSWIGGWIATRLPQQLGGADPVAAVVQLMLGLALACVSLRILSRSETDSAGAAALSGSSGLTAALLQGITLMGINLTSLVMFLPASQDIGRSGLPLPVRLAAWLVLDLLTLAPIWLPPVLVILSGKGGRRQLQLLGHWVQAHRRAIDAAVAAGFSVLLLGRGLLAL